jgi:hypothetical protein
MYHRKTEKQMSNVNSVKTSMLLEPSADNKSSLLLPQVQATNRLKSDKSMPMSATGTCGTNCFAAATP